MNDTLALILQIACLHLEKKINEVNFIANHAKILVSLDEIVHQVRYSRVSNRKHYLVGFSCQGHLDNSDVSSIQLMSKLKPFQVKT